jgi:reactive chlorine resistance protein C
MAGLQRGIPLNSERKSPGRRSDAGVSSIQVIVMLQAALLLIALSAALIAWSLQAGQYGSFTAITTFYTEATPALLARLALYQIWVLWAVVILALLALRWRLAQQLLAILLLLFSMLPLLSLFGSQHYIAGLGGFPIIGSGQGVIKFLALLVMAITLWRWPVAKPAERFWLNFLPLGLVLLWIGGMKFLPFEAKGIVDLVSSSPLLSWLYLLANEQAASNLIGIFDWLALVLLAASYRWPGLFIPGFLMCGSVFFTTQTFLFSFAGAWASPAVLSSSGVFIIKDLWFIANMLLLWHAWQQRWPRQRPEFVSE